MMRTIRTFVVLGVFFLSSNASAAVPGAYRLFAEKYQVPAELLFSICVQESGKGYNGRILPWPWTLNVAGQGRYFDSREEALEALNQVIEGGSCRVDIGICQVHWCSHRHNFTSPDALLDPYVNIEYAARLLSEEYRRASGQQHERWWEAVGRYHSPTPTLAEQYRSRVKARWLSLVNLEGAP